MDLLSIKGQMADPNIMMSRAEANQQFCGGGFFCHFFPFQSRGQFLGSHKIFIPYQPFQVRIVNRGCELVHHLALDSVTGELDLHCVELTWNEDDILPPESDHVLMSRLSLDCMQEVLLDQVRRRVYLSGFFGLQNLSIDAQTTGPEIYLPYWVGFYRKKDRVGIDVIDAYRKKPEGAKIRNLIFEWLKEQSSSYWAPFHVG